MIFHIDIDAFYASVEQIDDTSLRGKPVIVGGNPQARGVVSACSYEARRFGVHSAMPLSQALRRCPLGIFMPVRMGRYVELSGVVMAILESYTPEFRQISIDEAFLDLSGTERLYGPAPRLGGRIKTRVLDETGLTISIGIAANRFLAKLASEYGKPDGLYQVMPGEEIAFLDQLSLRDLWGVGEKTLMNLMELNITTVKRLRQFPLDILCSMMGEAGGRYLYRAVRGKDPGIYPAKTRSHSISHEITFGQDTNSLDLLKRTLLELSEQIMYRLIKGGDRTNTIVLKLRSFDFKTSSIQKTVKHWLTSSDEIYQLALELLKQKWNGSTLIRLIGVGAANVVRQGDSVQGELFDDEPYQRKRKVEETVTRLRLKMGTGTLTKASLLNKKRRG